MLAPRVTNLVGSPPNGRGLSPGFHSAWTNDREIPIGVAVSAAVVLIPAYNRADRLNHCLASV